MSKATLNDKDGQISLSLFLEGGYQASSNAHQHAGLILKHLDSLAGMKTEQAVQWVDSAYVPSAEMAVPEPEQQLMVVAGHGKHLHLVKSRGAERDQGG
jgi:hypothetical protein